MEVRSEKITMVDTKGHCFLCLGQISSELDREASSRELTSTPPVKRRGRPRSTSRRSRGPATPGSRSESPSAYSILGLSRYLGVDLRRVLTAENGGAMTGTGRSMISSVNKKVTLCGGCAPLGERFSEVYGQLEVIEMQVMACLGLIHQRLARTEEVVEVKRKFVKKFRGKGRKPGEGLDEQLGIVEELRKETFEKCSKKLSTFPPRVLIPREDLNELNRRRLSRPRNSRSQVGLCMISDIRADVKMEPVHEDLTPGEGDETLGDPDYDDDPSSLPEDDDQSEEEWERPKPTRRGPKAKKSLTLLQGRKPGSGKPRDRPWTMNVDSHQYQCILCTQQFSTIHQFYRHHTMTHLQVKHKCGICKKVFLDKQIYERHLRSVHTGVTFVCDKCNTSFTQKDNLRTHQKKRCGKEGYGSKGGGRRSSRGTAEENEEDAKRRKYKCPHCRKGFYSRTASSRHVRKACPVVKKQIMREEVEQGQEDLQVNLPNLKPPVVEVASELPLPDPEASSLMTISEIKAERVNEGGDFLENDYDPGPDHNSFDDDGPTATTPPVETFNEATGPWEQLEETSGDSNEVSKGTVKKVKVTKVTVKRPGEGGETLGDPDYEDAHSKDGDDQADEESKGGTKTGCKANKSLTLRPGQKLGRGKPRARTWTLNPDTHQYHCALCSLQFPTIHRFYHHHNVTHRQVQHECGSCQKVFLDKRYLKRHIRSVHTGLTFVCEKCNASFTQKYNLRMHQRNRCGKKGGGRSSRGTEEDNEDDAKRRKYKCPHCGRGFFTGSTRWRHVKTYCPVMKKQILPHSHPEGSSSKAESVNEGGDHRIDYYDPDHHSIDDEPTSPPTTPPPGDTHMCKTVSMFPPIQMEVEKLNDSTGEQLEENPGSSHNVTKRTAKKPKVNVTVRLKPRPRKHPNLKNPPTGMRGSRKNDYFLDRETRLYTCKLCPIPMTFPNYDRFFDHRNSVHEWDRVKLKCESCHKEFAREWTLTEHMNRFHRGISYDCEDCGKSFKHKTLLQRHCNLTGCMIIMDDSPVPAPGEHHLCDQCSEVFWSRQGLQHHLATVHSSGVGDEEEEGMSNDNDIKTNDCSSPTPASSSVPTNEEAEPGHPVVGGSGDVGHYEVDAVVLDNTVGKYSFEEIIPPDIPEEYKKIPFEEADPATGKWKCTLCPMEFAAAINFRNHYKGIHLKAKYKCNLCDKAFSQRASIYRHHQHEHQKFRISCPICKFQFKQKSDLNKHLRRTSCGVGKAPAPKKFNCYCHLCGKGLKSERWLKQHLQHTHNSARDHLCDLCGKGFKIYEALTRHRKTVHPESVVKVDRRNKKLKPVGQKTS